VLHTLPLGWRNARSIRHTAEYRFSGCSDVVAAYRVDGPAVIATVNGTAPGQVIVLSACTPDRVDLEIGGRRREYLVERAGTEVYVHGPRSFLTLTEVSRLADPAAAIQAGSLLAPMPAMVITVCAGAGDSVIAGTPLIVLEAMKMQHTILAPGDGVVTEMRISEGEQVSTGQVLAVMEMQDNAS
jgi:propionyl-CoA carboxylase alpha chain